MNTERILELADAIEGHKLPQLGFNMNYWNTTPDDGHEPGSSDPFPDYSGHNCGSVACIGGWLEALYVSKDQQHEWTVTHDAELLGISESQASELFFGYSSSGLAEITPAHAAQVLRHLAATGEVDWTIIRPLQEA